MLTTRLQARRLTLHAAPDVGDERFFALLRAWVAAYRANVTTDDFLHGRRPLACRPRPCETPGSSANPFHPASAFPMTSPDTTERAPARGAAGGMRALTLATLFAAASGYLVMLIAGRALGPADYPMFATYWGAFFALCGVANGLMQEATRAVRSARQIAAGPRPSAHRRRVRLPPPVSCWGWPWPPWWW